MSTSRAIVGTADTLPDSELGPLEGVASANDDALKDEARPQTLKLARERRKRRTPDSDSNTQDTPPPPALAPDLNADQPPESLPILDPKRWDRYEILKLLGRGGMGAVYEARDKRLGRHVAIKFIHSADPLTTKRFIQEARAQARVDHPNVCKVLEVGEVEGKVYITMPLIQGVSLADAAKSMSVDEKVRLMKTMSEAVHAAHRLGIIHRDIKPANIMVETLGEGEAQVFSPVLMDFGLAREENNAPGLTETGAVMGTPSYMPPEQARGNMKAVDARSDIYSLGATLYDLLAGVPPFAGDSALNILVKVLVQEPPPLRAKDPSLPPALDMIVGKCLNKEPHQRYATAADLADDLERFLNGRQVLARRLSLPTRLYWRGKRNKPMAFAILALIAILMAFGAYGARTVIVNARNEAAARKRAELGQKLGQAVKELEWLVRSAYLVPLHDTGPEKAAVRARMTEIEAEMHGFGDLGAGFDHYALGRGYLALQDWEQAKLHLMKAEASGLKEPELDYALGRVWGELYSMALSDARRSGDKSYFEKRKPEIDKEFLEPALMYLERCRGLGTVPGNYLEGLIHFYHGRHEDALREAGIAGIKLRWLYEAAKLSGDIFMARALDARDRGDNEQAERDFAQAVAHYEQAADIGRSDARVYEALAEAHIRWEEMNLFRGRDPKDGLEDALAAADKAMTAAPKESSGLTKKAFAYHFQARFAFDHGGAPEEVERLFQTQIRVGEQAIALHPEDAYAHEISGAAYTKLGEQAMILGQSAQPLLNQAYGYLEAAIRLNPRFPWAYNDYGQAIGTSGAEIRQHNGDARKVLERAIDMTKKAIELDGQYLVAYNNSSVWLSELAQWQGEHGENPEPTLLEAARMAEKAIQINGKNPLAPANAGLALSLLAAYRLEAGQDGREISRRAIARFRSALEIDPKFVFVLRELGRAFRLVAAHERVHNVDPQADLDLGLRAIEACYGVEPGNADCRSVEAELRAEQGEWAQKQAQSGLVFMEQAQRLARQAVDKLPERGDLWLTLGQICLRRAQLLSAGGASRALRDEVLKEGLGAVGQALKRAPGLGRALYVEAELKKVEAQE